MEMDGTPGVHAGLLPATSNATLEEPSTVGGGTWGEGDGEDDGDEDDVDYPESENEEEDEDTLFLRQEVYLKYVIRAERLR